MDQEKQKLIEEQRNLPIIDNFLSGQETEDSSPTTKEEVFEAIRWLRESYDELRGAVVSLVAELNHVSIKNSAGPEDGANVSTESVLI